MNNKTSATGVDYTSESNKVPPFFNRVGPGHYEKVDLEKLANRTATKSLKM